MKPLSRLREDILFKNSFFLMLGSSISYASGFFFWVFAGRSYEAAEVGVATSLISSLTLLISISRLGLNESLVRYFPRGDRGRMLSITMHVSALSALALGVAFLLGIDIWAPDLDVAREHVGLFVLILLAASVYSTTDASFIAMREAKWSFLQDSVNGVRMFLVLLFVGAGAIGIFASYGAASVIVALLSLLLVWRKGLWPRRGDVRFLRNSLRFSMGNHAASILIILPATLLPIMVLNILGAEASAFYYMAFQFAMVLNIIPNAAGTSLFAEGSHGEDMPSNALRSLVISLGLLLPAAAALWLLGGTFLDVIGPEYRENGLELLRWMILSSLFYVPIQLYYSCKKVDLRTTGMIVVSALDTVLIISLSVPMMEASGLVGIGHAFVLAHALTSLSLVAWERRRVAGALSTMRANVHSR